MEKKNIAIIVLIVALVASGVGNIILALPYFKTPPANTIFIRGTGAGPHTLDPMNSWDSASNDVLDQVFEGLFSYNLSDHDLPRVNMLAQSYYWYNETTLEVTLKQGVTFHDGGALNALAAKWSFDRLMYMCNYSNEANRMALFDDEPTGFDETNPGPIGEPASLYFFPDGSNIIDKVDAVGEYNLTFHLTAPFGPFLDLLCYEASKIVSPYSTPATDFIQLYGVPVGTGPFRFVSYTSGVEVRFERNDNYWRTPAYFTEMKFAIISDTTTRSNAMLNHQIDYLSGYSPSLMDTFRADPTIHVEDFTDNTGKPGLSYYYLGFNNVLINQTMREAISHAINYSYIIKNIGNDLAVRANSPISPGYGSAYNASVKAADFNLAHARQVIKDMVPGLTSGLIANNDTTGTNANAWKALNLATYNYTYNTDNSIRHDVGLAVISWLDQIGVTVLDNGVTWSAFLDALYIYQSELGIYWVGWGPDYLDPFNMLDPLFDPLSSSDSAQVDDAYLNAQLALALQTTNQVARNNIYKHIQWYLADVLRPHAFGYHPLITTVHAADLRGVAYNAMGNFEAYTIYRV